jgi:hypothetical protein
MGQTFSRLPDPAAEEKNSLEFEVTVEIFS